MRRIPLVYLSLDVGALLMGVMACSGDDDGGAVPGNEYQTVEDAQAQLAFDLIVPTYIPNETDPTAYVLVNGADDGLATTATVMFWETDTNSDHENGLRVRMFQQEYFEGSESDTCRSNDRFDVASVGSTDVCWAREPTIDYGAPIFALWVVGEVAVQAEFGWFADGQIMEEATPEMEATVRKIILSTTS